MFYALVWFIRRRSRPNTCSYKCYILCKYKNICKFFNSVLYKVAANEESRTTKALENGLHVDQKNKVYSTYILYFFNGSKVCYDFLQVSSLTYCKVLFFCFVFWSLSAPETDYCYPARIPWHIFSGLHHEHVLYTHNLSLNVKCVSGSLTSFKNMVFFVGISEYKKFNVMPRHPNARLIPYFFQFGIRDAKKAVMNIN